LNFTYLASEFRISNEFGSIWVAFGVIAPSFFPSIFVLSYLRVRSNAGEVMGFSFGGLTCPWVCKHLPYNINVGSTSGMWPISLVISGPGRDIPKKPRFSEELDGQSIGRQDTRLRIDL
jgi:hypothetical protein